MPRKDDRLTLSPLGEWYEDLLTVDAQINARSPAAQGNSLLCAKLQEREPKIKERVQYLAQKRKITFDEMWNHLLTGSAPKITPEEFKSMLDSESKEGE